jgi:hypothetical protein
MAISTSTGKVGPKPTKEEWKRIKAEIQEAVKYPINLDACPELSPEVLKEFAFLAAERDRCKKKQAVMSPTALQNTRRLVKGIHSLPLL